ncbi:GNAT family N-acetyltransferase [Streptomyces rishiriensis]|uniref:GNAT family N-acetyltransferase n=1 Tax=Streptomyces rishiriensis TaxID=68264 RepID=UPI000D59025E|nr:GNAT family N-acetyltransferase [Streptomyces rishiriensis]
MRHYCIRPAGPEDLDGARAVMLDTVYRDFGSGYVPRWHGDIIDPFAAYLAPERHTLLVALDGATSGAGGNPGTGGSGEVVATAALDSRGPAYPPNPRHVAERYPSGTTAQLRRVYVRREHRRRGLARRLVAELLAFAAADGGYRSVYLHTDPAVEGAERFWRSLGTVVHDEREEADGGQGVVHFDVPLDAFGPAAAPAVAPADLPCGGLLPASSPALHPPRTGR